MTENGSDSLPFEPPEQENVRLREENARLRRLLSVHSIPIPRLAPEPPPPTKHVETIRPLDKQERAKQRIVLSRSLFRGREDVYGRRWERDGKGSGYSPAAVKDWKAIKKTWEYDSLAFLETCQQLLVPAALERSRSGKGGHIWIFFDRPVPAITALRLAAFQNPEFYKAQAMRLATYDKPRVIACGQEFPLHIAVPRGCVTEVLALLEANKVRPGVRDERYIGTAIDAEFQGQLRSSQEEAVAKITAHDEGILCAPTAFGKTAVAAWLIAKRKVNTLVVVHRQQLLDQWQERLGMFLNLPAKSIGHIGGGKTGRTGCVDVAVIQSLYRKDNVKDFVAEYGQVIVDECHHISAFTFEQVMRQVKAKYVVVAD